MLSPPGFLRAELLAPALDPPRARHGTAGHPGEPLEKVYGLLGLPTIAATVGPSSLATVYNLDLSEVYADWGPCLLDPRFRKKNCPYWPRGTGIQFGTGDSVRRNEGLLLPGGYSLRRLVQVNQLVAYLPQVAPRASPRRRWVGRLGWRGWLHLQAYLCCRSGVCMGSTPASCSQVTQRTTAAPLSIRGDTVGTSIE